MNEAVRGLQTLFEVGSLGGLSDGQLLDRFVARRDGAVFEALIQRHGPVVWGVCRRVLRDHHDAEDAFQATFLVLARKASTVMPREKLGNWLYGVAFQTSMKARATRAKRRIREDHATEMPEPEAVSQNERDDLIEWLDEELSHLPEKYRIPIVLCELQGKTHREAADQLEWPIGTVSGRLSRARTILARRLSRQGLSLTVGALGVLLAEDVARAGVPPGLVHATARAASLSTVMTAGVVSAEVAVLTRKVLKTMLLSKLKALTAILMVVCALAAGGIGLISRRAGATGQAVQTTGSPESKEQRRSTEAPKGEIPPPGGQPRTNEAGREDTRRPIKQATVPGIGGDWEGTLKLAPHIDLWITLKVAEAQGGTLSGTWTSFDEGVEALPLASIAFKDGELTLTTKHGATYKGKRNADGTEVVGEWTKRGGTMRGLEVVAGDDKAAGGESTKRGRALPLTLKRSDPSKVVAARPIPGELEGFWQGNWRIGLMDLRLVLKVEKAKDGRLKAMLASPDQGTNNIPISAIELKGDTLTFESKLIGAKYSGTKIKDGAGYEGQFAQYGMKSPLALRKTDRLSAAARPQTPKPPFPYRSEEVLYENKVGAVSLAGTLTLPPGPGPSPAVIMLTGSGPQDRDENLLGHRPFLVIADTLTRRGIAVLRVDDRGVGGSSGSSSDSTFEDFAGDALASLGYLKGRKEIDPAKIGLIGHSEGAEIAQLAASRSKDVAFIVLMAGTGLPGDEIFNLQGQLIARAEGASESELKRAGELRRRFVDILLREKDLTAARSKLIVAFAEYDAALPEAENKALADAGGTAEATIGQLNNAWFRSFLAYDPRPTLQKVRCPVLAVNGEKDLQVPPKENLAEIEKALKAGGNSNVKATEFPGLNHLFQPCKTGSPTEYAQIETTIAPEVLKAIGDWIVEKVGSHADSTASRSPLLLNQPISPNSQAPRQRLRSRE
jgi:RNA polymerase sigma factor (sigma-70 family)